MHGSTEKMVRYLTDLLVARGIYVKPYNLVVTDPGEIAMVICAGILLQLRHFLNCFDLFSIYAE